MPIQFKLQAPLETSLQNMSAEMRTAAVHDMLNKVHEKLDVKAQKIIAKIQEDVEDRDAHLDVNYSSDGIRFNTRYCAQIYLSYRLGESVPFEDKVDDTVRMLSTTQEKETYLREWVRFLEQMYDEDRARSILVMATHTVDSVVERNVKMNTVVDKNKGQNSTGGTELYQDIIRKQGQPNKLGNPWELN